MRWTCTHVLMHIHLWTKVWEKVRGAGICTQGNTGLHIIAHNYATGKAADMGVRWTCIHVMMHVHLLTKVYDQM